MTNKQIIDGKECKYWFRLNPSDYRKCSLRGKNDNCDEITDCFIKKLLGKLALKEQECEKLYIQLKADEEYHKEEENNLRRIIKNKEERNIELYKENNKLKQTLAEIKEIANFDCTCGHTQMCICNVCDKIDEIIQKISECEENNDMENN